MTRTEKKTKQLVVLVTPSQFKFLRKMAYLHKESSGKSVRELFDTWISESN